MRQEIGQRIAGLAIELPTPAPAPVFTWRGTDRKGVARTGTATVWTADQMAEVVQRWYRAGWTFAEVYTGDIQTRGISPDPDTGKRPWWSEVSNASHDPAPPPS